MSVCDLKVLRAMVHKLSVELGREQGRRRETGCQLEDGDDEEAEWLTELGGLVPLLVAYEEELREVKAAKNMDKLMTLQYQSVEVEVLGSQDGVTRVKILCIE